MIRKESVDERLTKLIKYWDDVLANAGIVNSEAKTEKTTTKDLMKFSGLTEKRSYCMVEKRTRLFI